MSTKTTAINASTWTEIANFVGINVREMSISREEEVDFDIAYAPLDSTAFYRVTKSFIAFETEHMPSGGKVFAKTVSGNATIVVNWR